MAVPTKIVGLSGASLGAAGLGGYAVYSHTQSGNQKEETSYKSKLSHALLKLSGNDHQTQWGKRLASLKKVSDENTLVEGLKALKKKSPEATWSEVQTWCRDNVEGKFTDESELQFQNLRTYCVFSISEKIPKVIESTVAHSDQKWTTTFSSFGNYVGKLSSEFNTLKGSGDKSAQKLQELCVKYYDKPFLSEEDEEFKSVAGVCVSTE
ncbi:hypothetical protein HF1_12050 [Mycoplasma haemofelis str. Langford 1]|uniref:Uncharacterized protein n=1 Tax=Mycoplasma haemofelis (strain Langford 1) TaxID=941640 RepID=E8ZJ92_MYCHL|nr:hypothetical protein [Mycoplasma haemofelis]CBY93213.1 hypothetical protein HF1_12050 [Mycoplasma haemofelis str. Langford 1]